MRLNLFTRKYEYCYVVLVKLFISINQVLEYQIFEVFYHIINPEDLFILFLNDHLFCNLIQEKKFEVNGSYYSFFSIVHKQF